MLFIIDTLLQFNLWDLLVVKIVLRYTYRILINSVKGVKLKKLERILKRIDSFARQLEVS